MEVYNRSLGRYDVYDGNEFPASLVLKKSTTEQNIRRTFQIMFDSQKVTPSPENYTYALTKILQPRLKKISNKSCFLKDNVISMLKNVYATTRDPQAKEYIIMDFTDAMNELLQVCANLAFGFITSNKELQKSDKRNATLFRRDNDSFHDTLNNDRRNLGYSGNTIEESSSFRLLGRTEYCHLFLDLYLQKKRKKTPDIDEVAAVNDFGENLKKQVQTLYEQISNVINCYNATSTGHRIKARVKRSDELWWLGITLFVTHGPEFYFRLKDPRKGWKHGQVKTLSADSYSIITGASRRSSASSRVIIPANSICCSTIASSQEYVEYDSSQDYYTLSSHEVDDDDDDVDEDDEEDDNSNIMDVVVQKDETQQGPNGCYNKKKTRSGYTTLVKEDIFCNDSFIVTNPLIGCVYSFIGANNFEEAAFAQCFPNSVHHITMVVGRCSAQDDLDDPQFHMAHLISSRRISALNDLRSFSILSLVQNGNYLDCLIKILNSNGGNWLKYDCVSYSYTGDDEANDAVKDTRYVRGHIFI